MSVLFAIVSRYAVYVLVILFYHMVFEMKRSFLLAVTFVTVACGAIYETKYNDIPPKTQVGKYCASQCNVTRHVCQDNCMLRRQTCVLDANARAQSLYRESQIVNKYNSGNQQSLQSFIDQESIRCVGIVEQCSQICENDYTSCYIGCGGQRIPYTVCVAFCDKR